MSTFTVGLIAATFCFGMLLLFVALEWGRSFSLAKYCAWVRSMTPGERAILIVALLILFSVWLIYDVSK